MQNALENEQRALLWKLLGSPALLVTGHSRQQPASSILHKCPFLSPTNPSIFLNIYSNEKGRHTCTGTYIKNTRVPISCSILLGKKKRKSQRGRQCNGGGRLPSTPANPANPGLPFPEAPWLFTSPFLQKDCLRPLPPKNPNDIEKILHCSICQCIRVYPVSCPTDKQMYVLMCPGM